MSEPAPTVPAEGERIVEDRDRLAADMEASRRRFARVAGDEPEPIPAVGLTVAELNEITFRVGDLAVRIIKLNAKVDRILEVVERVDVMLGKLEASPYGRMLR